MSITVDAFGADGDRAGLGSRRAGAVVHLIGGSAVLALAVGCGWSLLSSSAPVEEPFAVSAGTRGDREPVVAVAKNFGKNFAKDSTQGSSKDSWNFEDRFAALVTPGFADRFSASAPSAVPSRVAGAEARPDPKASDVKVPDARVADAKLADARTQASEPKDRSADIRTVHAKIAESRIDAKNPESRNQGSSDRTSPDRNASDKGRKPATRLAEAAPVKDGWMPSKKDEPNIFERLFGKAKSSPLLAYASADASATATDAIDGAAGLAGRGETPALYDRQTAVYDITGKTLYLPNGTKIEAHSGLGEHFDKPESEKLRMRGVTPPHLYDLTMRESLFHGVEAIRLNPVGGEEKIHGRVGLLAHPYMLGGKGESNGCMSVKDYSKFLAAFKGGEIRRLAVVAKL